MKEPQEIEALADRIDHEQLWRRTGMDRDDFTPEQRDRLDAGVYLRRYAHDRFTVLEALKEGAEFMRGYQLTRVGFGTDRRGCGDHEWHVAINRYSDQIRAAGGNWWPRMMYTAKMVSDEVPRMILLFMRERTGLPTQFKACAHDPRPSTPLPDNHLRCALGQACRACPHLAAIEASATMTNEAKDEAKAWTCATHILLESNGDDFFESFLHDKSDAAYDARLANSLSQ
jgi:hypothetical protein